MSRTRARSTATALALCLTLAACGTQGSDPGSAEPTGTTTATSAAPTTDEDAMTSDKPTDLTPTSLPSAKGDLPIGNVPAAVLERSEVQAAVEAEAKRGEVEVDEVTVAGYAKVTWSDGSIGCPQPGMMYTQALVPGEQLVLEVDGQYASYHAAEGKAFSYCANPVAPTSGGTTSDM